MRTRRLIPAYLAVISLLVALPASAVARKHRSPRGRCGVSMYVAPHEIRAGDEVIVYGRLRCFGGASAAGQEVQLFHHLVGVPGYTLVQRATTDSTGAYELAPADGNVETNRSFFVRSHGARSATKRVRVQAAVTLVGPAEGQLLTGVPNRVTFTGTVSPADVGARVILQRQNALTGNEWHRIDSGFVEGSGNPADPTGKFTIVHRFIVPGDANIRVLVRSEGRNVPSESNILAYSISQAQNPALTIQASADPISFEQTVTISGKVTAGGEQPVTLLARTVHQRGFAPIAQIDANASGEYSFPAQMPVNSTFYRVLAGGGAQCPPNTQCLHPGHLRAGGPISSAVLYEGVKDLLTAQASPTTIKSSESVTFSGTVAPDHTGHVIYLERQDAHASAFHVVQVAYVGAGSSYSIVHQFYVPGTKVMRVYIPGGPDNQGAASQPFSIQVTPTPASSLMAEMPGSSSLPAEGES